MSELIYLDNAATTKVAPEVYEAMNPYFEEYYGNAASVYRFAGESKKAVENARKEVADFLGAKPNEIYFTGGGSESDNWALKGLAFSLRNKGKHIITSAIEHHAILHTCEYLEKLGYEITYVGVDENGILKLDELEKAIREDTILISVMFANNEIGSIQPINVDEYHIDLLSASGHKINGPKGIGILYVRNGVKIESFVHGGAQERGKRAGTHNTPGIVGFGRATTLAKEKMEARTKKEVELRDYLIKRVLDEVPYTKLNGDKVKRLPNNVNFSFQFIEGESLLIMLDQKGICASSGSACTSGSLDPSHVLLAIGLPHEIAHGSLRLTLSDETTKEEIDYTVEAIKTVVERLRSMSPLYEDFVKKNKQ